MTILEAMVASQAAQIDVRRPRFSTLWEHYPVGMAAPDVYRLVGGNAYELYQEDPVAYANACAQYIIADVESNFAAFLNEAIASII